MISASILSALGAGMFAGFFARDWVAAWKRLTAKQRRLHDVKPTRKPKTKARGKPRRRKARKAR